MTPVFPSLDIPGAQLIAASAADSVAMADLARRAHSHPWSEKQYRDSLEGGHQCWLLLSAEGEVIACCVISLLFDEAEILDVAVSPDWRRRGIAESLLAELIARLPVEICRLLLEVRASNRAALSLYRKLGFHEDGVRKNYYPADAGLREDALLMSRSR
ncbi:ribosomal-protein-alanine N-acetyltransferase [Microbulbifer donghaiensis]|uniref:Ribosomal-protein-alanine N-acetyltransferase n=1 Tax=Microbulbifer donghaiensis TaxID=494016 RepID=A0A1M5D770_9GAMM|nr:ribosomal protein S18-alanine N-acetyltransferase [Microbulbifer donghaiensis]SHF62873.1 ribosomal-protein-alanine N-acetyltransferase [Microbulbifer donghaiensis]